MEVNLINDLANYHRVESILCHPRFLLTPFFLFSFSLSLSHSLTQKHTLSLPTSSSQKFPFISMTSLSYHRRHPHQSDLMTRPQALRAIDPPMETTFVPVFPAAGDDDDPTDDPTFTEYHVRHHFRAFQEVKRHTPPDGWETLPCEERLIVVEFE